MANPVIENLRLVFNNRTDETLAATAWERIKLFYMFQTRQATNVEVIQFEDHNPIFSLDWNFLEWVAPYMERLGYRWALSDNSFYRS